MNPRAVTAFASILLVLGPACGPRAGARCENVGEITCPAKNEMLTCVSGTLAKTACSGPAGCTVTAGRASCDRGWEEAGMPCDAADERRKDCSADGKRELSCRKGRLFSRTCPDEKACSYDDRGDVLCDGGDPEVGTTCVRGVSPDRCSAEGDALFYCDQSRWKRIACAGTRHCRKNSALGAMCDETLGAVGDACHFESPEARSCTLDRGGRLRCESDQWVLDATCPPSTTCQFDEVDFSCGRSGCWMAPKAAVCRP